MAKGGGKKGPDPKIVSGAAKRLQKSGGSKQDRSDAAETLDYAKQMKKKGKGK